MSKLDEIQAGALVEGLTPGRPVTVIATTWHGDHYVEVFFEDADKGFGQDAPGPHRRGAPQRGRCRELLTARW